MTILDHDLGRALHVYGEPRLLAGAEQGRVDLTRHRSLHGEPALRRRSWLSTALHEVNLLGRGGAAFPVAAKLDAMATSRVNVLANGSESEPASRKDRALMTMTPHLVLDGVLVAAHALDTHDVTIVVHDARAHASMRAALAERSDASGVRIVKTGDSFAGGEIRAVIAGLNGGRAAPGGRRVLPHDSGVAGRSTFASNVETFAHIALLSQLGVSEYSRTGSASEPGTSLVTLIGDVSRPGVVEVPNGVPLSALLPGASQAPILVGGYHGTWVNSVDGLTLDRAVLRGAGVPLGAGVIARPFEGTCVLDEVVRVSAWLASESLGQCGPCFFGLPALADDIAAVAAGAGPARLKALAARLPVVRGRGACAHPDGSVQFIGSAVHALQEEIASHAAHGTCGRPPSNILPLPRTRS